MQRYEKAWTGKRERGEKGSTIPGHRPTLFFPLGYGSDKKNITIRKQGIQQMIERKRTAA